ncbi:hypothetical protein CGCSCA4_v002231 [Colletotrichum siamense]|uniref:Aminoglycoside phosphotransferase domain-containing protein n=1 Tax=Colletotrichum siamense TaxID=690259 RepID=A0A9P5F0L0_COLSI|nr:hypothetical protein CGCSCA4_v002231 [Colletotrichum siamense]KAF4863830.1 hypothetical protein CGCSCA2_v002366 [Colletotrichum siamense]
MAYRFESDSDSEGSYIASRFADYGFTDVSRSARGRTVDSMDWDIENPFSNLHITGSRVNRPTGPYVHVDNNMGEQVIVPDLAVFQGMFGSDWQHSPRHTIIFNTIDTCEFVIDLTDREEPPDGLPTHLMARIEKPRRNNQLLCSAAFQKLAHRKMPSLVPKVWGAGTTRTRDGLQLHYLLSQHYPNAVPAEKYWDEFNPVVKKAFMKDIVDAMSELQKINFGDLDMEDWVILSENGLQTQEMEDIPAVGNSQVGWFSDMASFLTKRLSPGNARYELATSVDGSILLDGDFKKDSSMRHQVEFTPDNLALLTYSSAFCHNDLEPRNILMRPRQVDFGPGYELVAITNFDSAGFFPFAYETAIKDTLLGLQNRCASWYELYKDMTHRFLWVHENPTGNESSQEKLIRAIVLTDAARKNAQGFNVGNRVQEKWLEREMFVRGLNGQDGFVRPENVDKVFKPEDDARLEEEAMEELGYI